MVQMSVARLGLVFLASQNFLPYLSLLRRAPYDYDNYYNLYFAIVIIVDSLPAVKLSGTTLALSCQGSGFELTVIDPPSKPNIPFTFDGKKNCLLP
jgi:hypothetical protein